MGVFSSGTEGLDYQANYCERCVHFKGYADPDGCPVWQLHELFGGVGCARGDELVPLFHGAKEGARWHGPTAKTFLDSLIPLTDKVWNQQCAMFHPLSSFPGKPPVPTTKADVRALWLTAATMLDTGDVHLPISPDATVLVACMHCDEMVEVRTGCRGIDDALSAGWTLDGAGDMICVRCSEARAEMIGDER